MNICRKRYFLVPLKKPLDRLFGHVARPRLTIRNVNTIHRHATPPQYAGNRKNQQDENEKAQSTEKK